MSHPPQLGPVFESLIMITPLPSAAAFGRLLVQGYEQLVLSEFG